MYTVHDYFIIIHTIRSCTKTLMDKFVQEVFQKKYIHISQPVKHGINIYSLLGYIYLQLKRSLWF